MTDCTHEKTVREWVPEEAHMYGVDEGRWEWRTEGTYEDIDTGRFKCTQCNKVFYYTGLWREHWEGGRTLLNERTGMIK